MAMVKKEEANTCFPLNDFDDNVLVEVLLRVPTPKIGIACKSVCKRWYSLISAPYFISRFISHHIANDNSEYQKPIGFLIGCDKVNDRSYLNNDHSYVGIVSVVSTDESSRGLLALPNNLTGENWTNLKLMVVASCQDLILAQNRDNRNLFYVYNLFTMKYVAISVPSEVYSGDFYTGFGLICEPYYFRGEDGEYHVIDLEQCRFRMVVIPYITEDFNHFAVKVYSSETGKWEEKQIDCEEDPYISTSNVLAFKRRLYWCGYPKIVAFDPFDSARTRFISRPDDGVHRVILGVCQGKLRMMKHVLSNSRYGSLLLWEQNDAEEWIEREISYSTMWSNDSVLWKFVDQYGFYGILLACHPKEDIVLFGFDYGIVAWFKMDSGELKEAARFPPSEGDYSFDRDSPLLMLPWWPTPIYASPLSN